MRIIRCDRCGHDIPPNTIAPGLGPNHTVIALQVGMNVTSRDVCAKCRPLLDAFFAKLTPVQEVGGA